MAVKPIYLAGLAGAAVLAALAKRAEREALRGRGAPSVARSRKVEDLHPDFIPKVREWERRMRAAGIPYNIYFTYRSPEEQRRLKAAGKSKIDFGYHNVGLAFDFTTKVDGKTFFPQPDSPRDKVAEWAELQREAGEIGKSLGMVFGGDWGTPDEDTGLGWDAFHLEWHPGLTIARARQLQNDQGYGGFQVG